jgi:hypothetical protein
MENKKKVLQEIKELWVRVERIADNKGFAKYGTELLNVCLEESKSHDRFRGSYIGRGMSIKEEARFFALSRVLESVYNLAEYKPNLKDFLHIQKSVFYAYALGQEFKKNIKTAISKDEAQEIVNLDYCELIAE